MTANARVDNLGPLLRYRAAGVLRKIVFSGAIAKSMGDWYPLELWRSESTLPGDWPTDDPRVPTEWGSLPVWFEGTYRGMPGRAPTSIAIYADDGTKLDELRVVAWWNYNPETTAPRVVRPPAVSPSSPLPPVLPAPPVPPWAPAERPTVKSEPSPIIIPKPAPREWSSKKLDALEGAVALGIGGTLLTAFVAGVVWWRSR